MSNRPKPNGKPFSLDRYRSEVKGEPFVLWVDDDTSVTIPRPSGNQMFDAEEAARTGTSRDVIEVLCGDQTEAFLDAIGNEDALVMKRIVTDMQEHFGMGE